MLNLIATSKYLLTCLVRVPDPNNAANTIPTGVLCDLTGNPLGPGVAPIECFTDMYSGKAYAKVADHLPVFTDTQSLALKASIQALNPISFTSDDGNVRGLFVLAPDFSEGKPAPVPVVAAPVVAAPVVAAPVVAAPVAAAPVV